jgi:ABC-type multidrug transport system fused ATPase/permease subunit
MLGSKTALMQDFGYQPIRLNGDLAYVSQTPWLQDASIRDNILFGNDFDYEWYQMCIRASELLEDISSLREGDHYSKHLHMRMFNTS